MISLFLGEFYRLCWKRRLGLVGIGIILSFLFNVCRTALLTWVAAKKGVSAIATYHVFGIDARSNLASDL